LCTFLGTVALIKSRIAFSGGQEKYARRLAEAFQKRGCEVTLLTTGPKIPSIHTVSLADDSRFSLWHLTRFNWLCNRWLRAHPQEIVFGMERMVPLTHYRAGSGVHRAFLERRRLYESKLKSFSCQINPLHRYLLSTEKKLFLHEKLQHLFVNSQLVLKEVTHYFGMNRAKISVVHNGVEWSELEPDFTSSLSEKKEDSFHFLFIGNGYLRKGLPLLLQGLALLKRQEWKLTVVGKERNPPLFYRYAEKLGLKSRIQFLGLQRDLRPHYAKADALVIPSLYDPFANVTLEALAMGLFIVSSPFNGGAEILSEKTGIVIPDMRSAQSMAGALCRALEHPKTAASAPLIRNSIKDLDFSKQLDMIVNQTINAAN
jgi:UDP-glucose:(heptosyl)LPS alpha-1,3-glucosyltransferase